MIINGKKTYLRAMEIEDMELYREMANNPDTEWMVGGWSLPISKSGQLDWFESVRKDRNNLRFTIVEKETEQAVGMVNLVDIDWKNRSAFHGVKLGPNSPKRKGLATDAVMAIMQYAFEELQLVRLDTTWIEHNKPSIKLYEKCGWKVEGKKEKASFKRGSYHTVLLGGILNDDYYMVKEKMGW